MAARIRGTIMTIEAPKGFAEALAADSTISAALFAWFSPAFPTGGFAYSHGLEAAAAEGQVTDERSLAQWLEGVLVARLWAALSSTASFQPPPATRTPSSHCARLRSSVT